MNEPAYDFEEAVEAWRRAYAGYREYLRASEVLYMAFAHNWRGPRRSLTEAFAAFREFLITEGQYRHPEVAEVYPISNLRTE